MELAGVPEVCGFERALVDHALARAAARLVTEPSADGLGKPGLGAELASQLFKLVVLLEDLVENLETSHGTSVQTRTIAAGIGKRPPPDGFLKV